MTILLVAGLAVVGLQACVAVGAVLYSRSRPRRMMCWAVRHRSEMTYMEAAMFRTVRQGQRAFASLSAVLQDELRPALGQLRETLESFGDMLSDVQERRSP